MTVAKVDKWGRRVSPARTLRITALGKVALEHRDVCDAAIWLRSGRVVCSACGDLDGGRDDD